MTYSEYKKALAQLLKSAKAELDNLREQMDEVQRQKEARMLTEKEAWERDQHLAEIYDKAKNRHARAAEHLKMEFARQDAPIEIGNIVWAKVKGSTKVLRVTEVRMAAFDYPMLKVFGIQLTMYGQPYQKQKEPPHGGIYQKDIISINGEPYTYKTR